MAYIGYFRSLHKNKLYSVTIRKSGDTSTPKEIVLAGSSPFVLRYEENSTPFDPIRNSTATISIVSDHYFEDVLPNKSMDTEVILRNESDDKIVWVGYLTPKIYSQPYENCLEVIQLEASDCVSILQYFEYLPEGNRGITTFKDIIIKIIDDTLLKGFYWPLTKKVDNTNVYPDQLKISEMNFFTSDTDEAWDGQEVLKEMCKYLGMTAVQVGEYLYFADFTALNNADRFSFVPYLKATDYGQGSSVYSGVKRTITPKDVVGNGENISFEPIYNKFVVKDSFYTCEEFITNIFEDKLLTNRNGEFFSSIEIPSNSTRATYPWGSTWFHQKYVNDEDDTIYLYFHRLYDHKDYESVYRFDTNLTQVYPVAKMNTSAITTDYVGATIVDFGRVRKDYVNDAYQMIIANKVDWERYLCINQLGEGWLNTGFGSKYAPARPTDNMVIFRLKPGSTGAVMMDGANSYLIINFKLLFTKYQQRNYINPDWTKDVVNMSSWESGTLIEACGRMAFRLGIGGKYWNGTSWQSTPCSFDITCTRDEDQYAYIMDEKEVLNNVSWQLNIDEQGYKIPLNGVDTAGELVFDFFLPQLQIITDFDGLEDTKYNGYCWIRDFSIKTATIGQDQEVEESDVVYENIIDEDNVNTMSDIDVKFTTSVSNTKPSYSNVLYYKNGKNTFLKQVKETGLNGEAQAPEENIIQRYYQQYSTPTKRLNYAFPVEFGIFDKYYGMDVDNPNVGYVSLGTEIDFAADRQEITLVEKK
jgi:hypothetical protein